MDPIEYAFKKEMEGKQYGEEETANALLWFKAGYNRGYSEGRNGVYQWLRNRSEEE